MPSFSMTGLKVRPITITNAAKAIQPSGRISRTAAIKRALRRASKQGQLRLACRSGLDRYPRGRKHQHSVLAEIRRCRVSLSADRESDFDGVRPSAGLFLPVDLLCRAAVPFGIPLETNGRGALTGRADDVDREPTVEQAKPRVLLVGREVTTDRSGKLCPAAVGGVIQPNVAPVSLPTLVSGRRGIHVINRDCVVQFSGLLCERQRVAAGQPVVHLVGPEVGLDF